MEKDGEFSISKAISYGWDTTLKNWRFLVPVGLILAICQFGGQITTTLEQGRTNVNQSGIIPLILTLIGAVLGLGAIKIALNYIDKKESAYRDLLPDLKTVINALFASILLGLIVLIGLILLVVPGIIWGIKFGQATHLIVDKKLNPIEALKKSSEITAGEKWHLFLFGLVAAVVQIAGLFVFGVGTLITIPTVVIAQAYVYRKLLKGTKSSVKAELEFAPAPNAA